MLTLSLAATDLEGVMTSQFTHEWREVFDALSWIVRAGFPWRMLPHDIGSPGKRSTTRRVGGPAPVSSRRWSTTRVRFCARPKAAPDLQSLCRGRPNALRSTQRVCRGRAIEEGQTQQGLEVSRSREYFATPAGFARHSCYRAEPHQVEGGTGQCRKWQARARAELPCSDRCYAAEEPSELSIGWSEAIRT